MSPGEVVVRTWRMARHRSDALTYHAARGFWRRAWTPSDHAIDARRAPVAPLGFVTSDRAGLVRERDPEAASALVTSASEIAGRTYRYFGYPPVRLSEPIDFALDPMSGQSWPRKHGKRIDYRVAEFGDPKWIWELNRLQELPLLAAATLLTEDERYARRGLELARRWIDTSEPGRGIAWSNGFEAGLRAISLALFLDAMRGSRLVGAADADRIVVALWQHARWIERDPSTHSSANNHVIGELAGLVAIGLLAPELRDRDDLVEKALADLAVEAERQIAPDGTSVEQAFRYHLFVLDLLLTTVALLDACGRSCPVPIVDALARSGRALAAQLGTDDPEPTYGDADDGVALRLDGGGLRAARGAAASIAARLGHPEARVAAGRLDAMACWLFGATGAQRFDATEPAPPPGSSVLHDAGLVVLRAGSRRVLFDVGPLGYLATAAHGHADALQVTVSDSGQDLVVDPGVGSYFGDRAVRAALRGTAAHATVTVDGVDQSEAGGAFLWTRHATARLVSVDAASGRAVGLHDGYRVLPDPVTHRRLVHVDGGGPILVVDRLESGSAHEVVQTWPLHPELNAVVEGGVVRAARDGRPRLVIAVQGTSAGRLDVARGERDPLRGWYSRRLEHVEPAYLASWSASAVGPLHVVALVWPLSQDDWPDPALEIVPGVDVLDIRFVTAGATKVVTIGSSDLMIRAPRPD
jgi:hypothetical protein